MMNRNIPPIPKPCASARCHFCGWSIEFRGYDAVEAATFLHARLVEHVTQAHRDKVEDKNMLTAFNVGGEPIPTNETN